jgi:hypothetical protein
MKTLFVFALCLCLPGLGFGKAAYYGKAETIKQAEFIAIVDIATVEPAGVKGKVWTYGEIASAKVERVLKGELPKEVKLHGKEDFICAQVRYKPGRQLVFLQRDGDLFVGWNWHLGVRPISGDKIEWFADDKNLTTTSQDLKAVLAEIEAMLKQ